MAAVDERVEIIEKILANDLKKAEVEKALTELENEFGDNAYVDDGFSPKEKPWNKGYYTELEKVSLTGVSSKKYILHLVEVRDYLRFKMMATVGGVIGGIAIVIGLILALC